MIDEKLLSLLRAIVAKTDAGNVRWVESAAKDVFVASLGDFTLRIESEDGYAELAIFDSERNRIATLQERELRERSLGDGEALEHLYENARKMALNVDNKVDALLQMLA